MFGLFSRPKPQVLVAGAGPIGLFAALYLARHGVKVEIVDEEWRGATHSYALALHPRTLELLKEMGVVNAVLARARRVHSIALYEGNERRASVDLRRLETTFPFIAVLPQSELETVLADALRNAKLDVHWGRRVARVEQTDRDVHATIDTLEKVSTGYAWAHEETEIVDTREIDVPFVIGADGYSSVARQQVGIKFVEAAKAQNFAVTEFEADGDHEDEVRVVLDEGATSVLWPMPDNHVRFSFEIDSRVDLEDSRDKPRMLISIESENFRTAELEKFRELAEQRAPWFEQAIDRVRWHAAVRFERRLASAFGNGRVWLAGDSAHMTGPVGAQSMNIGLLEAAELCRVISRNLAGDDGASGLSDYSNDRLAEWRFLLGVGAPSLQRTSDASSWVADRAQRLVACIPASGDHFDQIISQFGLERSHA